MPKLVLYFSPGASSFAPHMALHEIGAPFETKLVSLAKKEQKQPAYVALNPEGKVPTLTIDGRPLTEVVAILYYLAKAFPQAKLLPHGDIEAEAQALSWMSFTASTLHPSRRQGEEHVRTVFGYAEQKLAGRPWVLRDFSIADIHLFRLYWRNRNAGTLAPDAFPGLQAHHNRMLARPAVKKTLEVEKAAGYELP